MSAPTPPGLPDYDAIGADFDRGLPALQPVADEILDHLPTMPEGTTVIDLACGTGEPGLSLARRSPAMQVLGVDQAPGMVGVARAKAERESLTNARFEVMSVEELSVRTGSVGGAVSRFGLLSFGDPAASARELARVLAPGAPFSVAVWETSDRNALLHAVVVALHDRVPTDLLPPVTAMDALAADGLRERWLRAAALSTIHTDLYQVTYEVARFDSVWESMIRPGVFERGFAALDQQRLVDARGDVERELAQFRAPDGSYSLPAEYRLLWGTR